MELKQSLMRLSLLLMESSKRSVLGLPARAVRLPMVFEKTIDRAQRLLQLSLLECVRIEQQPN